MGRQINIKYKILNDFYFVFCNKNLFFYANLFFLFNKK